MLNSEAFKASEAFKIPPLDVGSALSNIDPHPEYKLLREQIASAERTEDLLKAMTQMQADSVELMRQTVDLNRDTVELSGRMAKGTKTMTILTAIVCVATLITLAVSAATCSRASQTVVVHPLVTLAPSPAASSNQP